MAYKIMSNDLKSFSLVGPRSIIDYCNNKEKYINPNSINYGDVLVTTKHVFSGFTFKIRFFFKKYWTWKPQFKHVHDVYYLHWLSIMFWFECEYTEEFDRVVKDHLSELKKYHNETKSSRK